MFPYIRAYAYARQSDISQHSPIHIRTQIISAHQAPKRKTSIFHYYKKEKEVHPELRLRPKKSHGGIKERPVHDYVPRKKFDEIEDDVHEEKNIYNMKELLHMYWDITEKNRAMRGQMFLSIPPTDEKILKITTNERYLQESKQLLHETELGLRRADNALKDAETELDTLLRAKKKDKISIAAAHKEYRECNKIKSRAEKALFNICGDIAR